MTDHILGTEFNYQNLVPVGTGQKIRVGERNGQILMEWKGLRS